MTSEEIQHLQRHYERLHGVPIGDYDAVEKLTDAYSQLFKVEIDQHLRDGIAQQYRWLQSKGIPAYLWMLEAFHSTIRKVPSKQNFGYVVGTLRNWQKNGFGTMPATEIDDVIDFFEEVIGKMPSNQATILLRQLMASYGSVRVTRGISELQKSSDMSKLYVHVLSGILRDKFPDIFSEVTSVPHAQIPSPKLPRVAPLTQKALKHSIDLNSLNDVEVGQTASTAKDNNVVMLHVDTQQAEQKPEQEQETKIFRSHEQVINTKGYKEAMSEESIFIEMLIIEHKQQIKFSKLKRIAESHGCVWGSNPHGKMAVYLKHNPNIIKVGTGGMYSCKQLAEVAISAEEK